MLFYIWFVLIVPWRGTSQVCGTISSFVSSLDSNAGQVAQRMAIVIITSFGANSVLR